MRPNPKIIRWTVYILLGLFLIWSVDKIAATYYIIKTANTSKELEKAIADQNDKNKSDDQFYLLCDSLVDLNQIDKAITLSQARISTYPDDKPYLTLHIGDLYFTKRDTNMAIRKYSEAINMTNSYVRAYVHRGLTYLDKNELDSAIYDFEKAASMNWEHYYKLGFVQEKKGLLGAAKKSYETYLGHYPDNKECKERIDSVSLKLNRNNGS